MPRWQLYSNTPSSLLISSVNIQNENNEDRENGDINTNTKNLSPTLYTCVGEGARAHMWRSAGNLQGWFSPSTMWVPGTELRFTHWATLKAQAPLFEKDWLVINVCCVRAYVNVCGGRGVCRARRKWQIPSSWSYRQVQAAWHEFWGLELLATTESKQALIHGAISPAPQAPLLTTGLSTTQNGFVDNAHTNMHAHARPHMLIVPYSLFILHNGTLNKNGSRKICKILVFLGMGWHILPALLGKW